MRRKGYHIKKKLCASCFEKFVSMKKSNCGPRECFNDLSVDEDDLTVIKNEIYLN